MIWRAARCSRRRWDVEPPTAPNNAKSIIGDSTRPRLSQYLLKTCEIAVATPVAFDASDGRHDRVWLPSLGDGSGRQRPQIGAAWPPSRGSTPRRNGFRSPMSKDRSSVSAAGRQATGVIVGVSIAKERRSAASASNQYTHVHTTDSGGQKQAACFGLQGNCKIAFRRGRETCFNA